MTISSDHALAILGAVGLILSMMYWAIRNIPRIYNKSLPATRFRKVQDETSALNQYFQQVQTPFGQADRTLLINAITEVMQRVALLQHDLPQLEGSFPYFKLREYRRFCLNVKATRFQVAEVRREVEITSERTYIRQGQLPLETINDLSRDPTITTAIELHDLSHHSSEEGASGYERLHSS